MKTSKLQIKALLAIFLLGMSTGSYAMSIIYTNDFSANSNGWSGGELANGRYQQTRDWRSLRFNLDHPAINDSVSIMFDVITLGDWEQSGQYEDDFKITNRIEGWFNDVKLFDGNLQDGSNAFSFNNIATWDTDELKLKFSSDTTASSEKFAIDNFKVFAAGAAGAAGAVNGLPEPGTAMIFLMGLAGIACSRRRRHR